MAKEAGATMIDMEFLEFEPMVMMDPPGTVGEPAPTAMTNERLIRPHPAPSKRYNNNHERPAGG